MQIKEGSPDQVAQPMGTMDAGEGAAAAPWGPMGADGGPIMRPMPPPIDARPFTPQHSPCLRACRHYFLAVSHFDHGNPEGTFAPGQEPKERHHICMRIPGVYLELSGDSPVYECTRWDPEDPTELVQLRARREAYYEANPDHRPIEASAVAVDDDLSHIGDEDDDDSGTAGTTGSGDGSGDDHQ